MRALPLLLQDRYEYMALDLVCVATVMLSLVVPITVSLAQQVAVPINSALAKLRSAGAVLVPFDSSAFQELAVSAWPGATAETINNLDASSDYESIEVLGRQAACTSGASYNVLALLCKHSLNASIPQFLHASYVCLACTSSSPASAWACYHNESLLLYHMADTLL